MAAKPTDLICQNCGAPFYACALAKWCSESCRKKAARKRPHIQHQEREYRASRKQAASDYHREYRKSRGEQISTQQRLWYEANKAHVSEQRRLYRAERPEMISFASAKRRAIVRAAPTVPFTPDDLLAKYSYYGNKCWLCGRYGQMTMDHVKPLSKGGMHCLSNIRPACAPCNSRKGAKWPIQ